MTDKVRYIPSTLKCYALRLGPGEEIKSCLLEFVKHHNLQAAFILTCVGSVQRAKIRLANATAQNSDVLELHERYEIVSLVGTLSDGGHLHVSLADAEGRLVGGHVLGDMVVFTTAEVVIGECERVTFKRELDPRTGFGELTVNPRE